MKHAGAPVRWWLVTGIGIFGLFGLVVAAISIAPSWASAALVVFGVAALAAAVARYGSALVPPVAVPALAVRGRLPGTNRIIPLVLLALAAIATVATAISTGGVGEPGVTNADIARYWLLSIAQLLIAAWWEPLVGLARRLRHGPVMLARPPLRRWGPWAGMIAIAAVPRLVRLDRFPTVIDGDEAAFMLNARLSQQGALPDPFGPGWFGNPNLYPVVQGWLAGVLGSDGVADYRTLTALVGVACVIATWRLGRYLVGPLPAATGAIVLAIMPLHVHMSRVGLNNITDPTAIAIALLFLVRSVRLGHRGDAVVSGIALGFGLNGYFGGRAFPVVILAVLVALFLLRRIGVVSAIRTSGWVTIGFLVSAMPLIIGFRRNPAAFDGHLKQVTTFSRERLLNDPAGFLGDYVENLRDAVLYPLAGNNVGYFRHDVPYLGWPVALLLTIGVAAWIARLVRDRDVDLLSCLLVPWAAITAGIALTTPIAGQRLGAITPMLALASGSGLVLVARWLAAPTRASAVPAFRVVVVGALLALAIGDIRWLTSEDRQIDNYGDMRTTAAWDMGWRLSQPAPPGAVQPAVLLAGAPYMYANGWNNLEFLAPDLEISDAAEAYTMEATPATRPDGTMLVLVAERASERCAVEALYPDDTVAEARDREGRLLYLAFYGEPLTGWSMLPTPAGTTFSVVIDSPCA